MTDGYEGVLFDLFGTLVDFRSTYVATLDRILEENDLLHEASTFQVRWQEFVFQGVRGGTFITVREDFAISLERVLDELGVEGDTHRYSQTVIDDMFRSMRVADLFPEVPGVLNRLGDAGIGWAIVSNIDESDLRHIVQHHGLDPPVTISSESVRAYKPEPEPFTSAMDQLDLTPERTIHVGDTPTADVVGALSLGIGPVWVNRYGMEYPEKLPRPKWEVTDLTPVVGICKGV